MDTGKDVSIMFSFHLSWAFFSSVLFFTFSEISPDYLSYVDKCIYLPTHAAWAGGEAGLQSLLSFSRLCLWHSLLYLSGKYNLNT